jgi:hypothetical protein
LSNAPNDYGLRDYVEKNQDLALRTDHTVIVRTKGQLLWRNVKLCALPWLWRFGFGHVLRTQLRTAATDLSLSSHDLQRCESRRLASGGKYGVPPPTG